MSYFFYIYIGDIVKIYLDLVLFINFFFDFLLLISVGLILKRTIKIKKILLAALIGSLSIIILFVNMNSVILFFFKLIISIIMLIVSYGYKSINYLFQNICYLYVNSIVLGGFLYYLNIELNYKYNGMSVYKNGLYLNFLVLILISPIIIYFYIRSLRKLKNNYNNYYQVDIFLNEGQVINITAFLDTGNKLLDPYFKKPIIIINKDIIKNINNYLLVPFNTIKGSGILKCIKPEKVYVDGIEIKRKVLIGISEEKINIDGIDCILNEKIFN